MNDTLSILSKVDAEYKQLKIKDNNIYKAYSLLDGELKEKFPYLSNCWSLTYKPKYMKRYGYHHYITYDGVYWRVYGDGIDESITYNTGLEAIAAVETVIQNNSVKT